LKFLFDDDDSAVSGGGVLNKENYAREEIC
jgi:hypothetical protein